MTSNQKRRIVLNSLLLLTSLLTLVAVANGESSDQNTFTEILQRITSAEREVGYVGKRISISWAPNDCIAHEELVVHQPPSTHFVKVLTPREGNRWSGHIDELRKRREALWRKEQRGKLSQREAFIKRRFERSIFSGQLRQQPIESLSQADIERLSQNYTFQHTASEEIAGYKTDLLTISSRFEGRPTKHIWIAKEKGIILRHEGIDAQGQLRFLSVYTQISFQPERVQQQVTEFREGKEPPTEKPKPIEEVSLSEAQEAFQHQLILPDYLPQGFELQIVTLMKFRPKPTVHLRYTDGLMVFSLFEEPTGKRPRERRMGSHGDRGVRMKRIHGTPVQIIDRRQIQILRWFQEDVGFTLIGELNRSEIIQIAESLIINPAQQ